MVKGWSAHAAASSLSSAGGALVLAAGVLLLSRLWRGAVPLPAALLPWRNLGLARLRRRYGGVRPVVKPRPALNLPRGLDAAAMTRELCGHFIRLQAAWDASDVDALGELTTGAMLDDLRSQLCEYGSSANRTDVLTLNASLLGYEQRDALELVCVEFSVMIREAADRGAMPFRELWMLERTKQPPQAWQLARQQTLL